MAWTNFQILKSIKNNPINLNLVVIILLIISSVIYSRIIENEFGNSITNSKIQKEVSSIEMEMEGLLTKTIQELNLNKEEKVRFTSEGISNINDQSINLYIFYFDSLIFWSDNEAIPLLNQINQDNTSGVILLNDGHYLIKVEKKLEYIVCATYLVDHKYSFENEYLQNQINPSFNIAKSLRFTYNDDNNHQIFDQNENSLFGVEYINSPLPNNKQTIILFVLYFLIIVMIYSFIYRLLKRKLKNIYVLPIYTLIIITILIGVHWLKFPYNIYQTEIFSPGSFAISHWFSSLGDLFFTVLNLLILILAIYNASKPSTKWTDYFKEKPIFGWISAIILITISYTILYFALEIIKNLIINSNIPFDISNFFDLTFLSLVGLITIAGTLLSVLTILIRLYDWYNVFLPSKKVKYGLGIIVSILLIYILQVNNMISIEVLLLYFVLTIILLFGSLHKKHYQLEYFIPILLILSFITAVALNAYNHEAEQLRRMAMVRSVANNQDPQAEYLFKEIENNIYKDSTLSYAFQNSDISFDSISNYILATYFEPKNHWKKYDLQATICDQEQELVIKPENITILCNDFFFNSLMTFGSLTHNKNLYHLNYGTGQINYLGLFRFNQNTLEGVVTYTIYLEINSKLKRKGFTKLLSEKENDPFEKIRNYSLAAYDHDTLTEFYGAYSYPEILENYMNSSHEMEFVDHNNYNHLVYRHSPQEVYVLSKKNPERFSVIAPFSYLFILYAILFLFFSILFNRSLIEWKIEVNFTARLQLTMIAIILVSFAIISYVSAHYIFTLNNDKNNQRLKDLSTSLQMEFEHKVRNVDVADAQNNTDYLLTLSNKFSKVFDTDINLYDLSGNLITSTRPEIFEQHLLSTKINPTAFYKLSIEKESFFVTNENIGNLVYSSAFLPFHNSKKEVVAYLNLPYFARQSELQGEVSNFLMTLLNVYTFIIVLSIIVILLISKYISLPLRMIKDKMKKITLGSTNEKIEWKGQDEIGKLVEEYNRMADQLTIKADLLAKSERESAWREMAKQVAHEIKNPLTPMKLSVQYLLRSWNEKDPDWEDRLFRLSDTLIQQIDTLSDIATAFSDFAKMPKSSNEVINLEEIIQHAIEIYTDYENVQIRLSCSKDQDLNIYADKMHLLRVFNNLIKNAIQSFDANQNGFIDIDIEEEISTYKIHIRDNGCGIPDDKKEMIFVPNFTTKSKGTGLGLAMVKNIILSFGGHISFTSELDKGTSFTILLPKYEYTDHSESTT